MKQKVLLLFILCLVALGWFYQSIESDKTSFVGSSLVATEQNRIFRMFEDGIVLSTKSKEILKDLNNLKLSTDQLLATYSAQQLQDVIQQEVIILADCLKKDFCGMRVKEQKGYYDESEVGGAKNLRYLLQHLVNLLEINESNATSVELPFEKIFALPNKENKILTVKLLLAKDSSAKQIESLMLQEELFTEESRGELYRYLFKYTPESSVLRSAVITNLLHAIQNEDSYLVMTLLEATTDFKLAEGEFFEVVKESCSFKKGLQKSSNWKIISLALREAIDKNRYSLTVEQVCR